MIFCPQKTQKTQKVKKAQNVDDVQGLFERPLAFWRLETRENLTAEQGSD